MPFGSDKFLSRKVPINKIEASHIDALRSLAEGVCGRKYFFPENIRCEKADKKLLMYKHSENKKQGFEIAVSYGEWIKCREYRIKIEKKSDYSKAIHKEIEMPYTKCFDYDIIKEKIVVRSRIPGDYIVISQDGKKQKIKKTFINQKIPQSKRESVPLIAAGNRVFWALDVKCGVETVREGKPYLMVTVKKEDN